MPDVFDKLIAAGEMPLTIGLFINPGVVPAANENAQPRFNRSLEYDGMGPDYANFLVEEMIPRLNLKISDNPDDRALCGGFVGSDCRFHGSLGTSGSVSSGLLHDRNLRGASGGNDYPALIRKTEPKPLRIFSAGWQK